MSAARGKVSERGASLTAMEILETALNGVLLLEPRVFRDSRGLFLETYRADRYREVGIPGPFVQENHSRSRKGVIRGIHYQLKHPQGKLVRISHGEVYDVAVDLRRGSPTFGQWYAAVLSSENQHQLYVPPGFGHAFCVISESADLINKLSEYYHPEDDYGIIWNDPDIGIPWPVSSPILSERDTKWRRFQDTAPELLPACGTSSVDCS
jgi:dTDP-4-dehydrorhamnose 3,5-epimerase